MGTDGVKEAPKIVDPSLIVKVRVQDFNRENGQVKVGDKDQDGFVSDSDVFIAVPEGRIIEDPSNVLAQMCNDRTPHDTGFKIKSGSEDAVNSTLKNNHATISSYAEAHASQRLYLADGQTALWSQGGYDPAVKACHYNSAPGITLDKGDKPTELKLSYTDATGLHLDAFDLRDAQVKPIKP